jgi:AcrR family transcriptional regulator
MELFASKGYEATTVEEIAAAAEVSPSTFFRYFESKEGVVFGAHTDAAPVLAQAVRDQPTSANDRAAVAAALLVLADHLDKHRDVVLEHTRLATRTPPLTAAALTTLSRWEQTLANELAHRGGAAAPHLGQLALAGAAIGVLRAAVNWWTNHETTSLTSIIIDAAPILRQPPARHR